MLEFDSSTLANMTAALDHGCKKLSVEFDFTENRKRIGNAIIAAAKASNRSLSQLIEVAENEVAEIVGPGKSSLFDRLKLSWK